MNEVRLGIIGCGGMGGSHLRYLPDLARLKLTAAADVSTQLLEQVVEEHDVEGFDDGVKLLDSGLVDAVLITTPHYFHPTFATAALQRGIHVMTEKPVSVTAKAAAEVNQVAQQNPQLAYAVMHQYRAEPRWQTLRQLLRAGDIGPLQRLLWTATHWFRSQAYYNRDSWRATCSS